VHNACTIFCLTKASATPDSFFSFPDSPISQRGGEPSAATGLSPAEDSGRKCIYQGAQERATSVTAGG